MSDIGFKYLESIAKATVLWFKVFPPNTSHSSNIGDFVIYAHFMRLHPQTGQVMFYQFAAEEMYALVDENCDEDRRAQLVELEKRWDNATENKYASPPTAQLIATFPPTSCVYITVKGETK